MLGFIPDAQIQPYGLCIIDPAIEIGRGPRVNTIAPEERLGEALLEYRDDCGNVVTIKPIIGNVKSTADDAFVCQVMIEGLLTRPQLVFGNNSFQAVCQSFIYLAHLLKKEICTRQLQPLPVNNFDPFVNDTSIDWFDALATFRTKSETILTNVGAGRKFECRVF